MANKRPTVTIKITADDKDAEGSVRRLNNAIKDLGNGGKLSGLKNEISSLKLALTEFAGNLASKAVSALTSKLYEGVSALLDYSSQLEQARIGFTTMTGSAVLAQEHLKDLQDFAKTTPFEFSDLVSASQKLQGVGFEARKVIPALTDVGNALAAAGRISELPFATKALGDIQAKGKLAGQEIIQLANAGIPALQILSKELGVTTAEVIQLGEDGRISSDLFFESLHRFSQEKFGDAMFAQSKTAQGAMSNIKDALYQTAAKAFAPLYERISTLAVKFGDEINAQGNDFEAVGRTIAKYIGTGLGLATSEIAKDFGKLLGHELTATGKDGFLTTLAYEFETAITQSLSRAIGSFREKHPNWATALLGTFSLVGTSEFESKRAKQLSDAEFYGTGTKGFSGRDGQQSADFFSSIKSGGIGVNALLDTTNQKLKDVGTTLNGLPSFEEVITGKKRGGTSALTPSVGGKSGGTGKNKANPFKEIQDYIRESGFTPGSAYRPGGPNGPTAHAGRGAVDTSVAANPGKTIDDYTRLIVGALERGKTVIDERLVGYFKGINSSGANVHIGNDTTGSKFLPQKYYSVPVAYLQELEAKRKSRKGLNVDTAEITQQFNEKLASDLRDRSDALTKADRDKTTRILVDSYKNLRLLPDDDLIRDFNQLLVEEARNAGKLQPSLEETARQFAGFKPQTDALPETPITTRTLNRGDQRFIDLRESLDLDKRQTELDERRLFLADEINIRADDYRLGLQEQLTDTQVEYGVLLQRNIAVEVAVEFEKERNAQIKETGDVEKALILLHTQNADNQFSEQRRLLASKREQLYLEQQITDLKDQVANGGKNNALEIEAAHLRDILDLRHKELDAVISINRAQLELANKGNYSKLQADAKVLEYLNQNIKSSTDAMADFKIGIASGFLEQIDSPFKKLNDRLEKLPPLVKGLAQSFVSLANDIVRAFSQKLIMRLLGLDNSAANNANNSSSNGGFNLGSLFGGGQGSSGGGFNLGSLFGGNQGGGIFNFGGGSSTSTGFGGAPLSSSFTLPGASLASTLGSEQNGGILSKLLGEGGLFGKEGFGNNVGTYSTVGAGATILGGLISSKFGGSAIGRRVGGILSGAGTGLGIGASIGTFILPGIGTALGALIGAGIGGLIGFFGAGGQRKKDEQARTQYINDALASFKDFDKIISDVRNLNLDPASGISQATALGANIRSNYLAQANQLKDNKTRNIAIKDVSRIDDQIAAKMKQLNAAADEARVANDIDKRLQTSFATGVYMDSAFLNQYKDYKRRNGMLEGQFTGIDTLPSMLAAGEMVLNPKQINAVIANAGIDPFKQAGIPGYGNGVYVEPSTSKISAPNFSNTNLNSSGSKNESKEKQPIFVNLYLNGDFALADKIEAHFETSDGREVVLKTVSDGSFRGDLKISSNSIVNR